MEPVSGGLLLIAATAYLNHLAIQHLRNCDDIPILAVQDFARILQFAGMCYRGSCSSIAGQPYPVTPCSHVCYVPSWTSSQLKARIAKLAMYNDATFSILPHRMGASRHISDTPFSECVDWDRGLQCRRALYVVCTRCGLTDELLDARICESFGRQECRWSDV